MTYAERPMDAKYYDDLKLIDMIPKGVKVYFTVPNFWAESHIRPYQSIREIVERFKTLDFLHCERFNNFFICHGAKT